MTHDAQNGERVRCATDGRTASGRVADSAYVLPVADRRVAYVDEGIGGGRKSEKEIYM